MINKSSLDTNLYDFFVLENGLKVLTISDSSADKSGCALSVNVGSFDEPSEVNGLAHFLEHMLFMGTETYPDENEYMEFLNMNNGYSNAYTSSYNTVYYFDVSNNVFDKALDRFSSFFKNPLLKKNSVLREISAVNSEYRNNINNDIWRIFRMFQIFSRKDLPESRFTVGNNDTLRIDNIENLVEAFWRDNYSSDKMCLVLYSNKNIETLKEYSKMFEGIHRIAKKKEIHCDNEYLQLPEIFDKKYLNRIIKISPIRKQSTLIVSLIVPSEYKYIKTNPYAYIDHIFKKKDEGGFVKIIKDKNVGFDASMSVENAKGYSTLQINISLTKNGSLYYKEVLLELLNYFRNFKISEKDYICLRDVKKLQFYYKEQVDPIECVENTSEIMQFLPIERIYDYDYVFEEFNSDLIAFIIQRICDYNNWLIFLLCEGNDFDKIEELYNIKYKIEEEACFNKCF